MLTGEIQVFESSLENCDAFKFTHKPRDPLDMYDLNFSMSPGIPTSAQEMLGPWCYASLATDGYVYSLPELPIVSFVNKTQLIYKCANLTSVEDQDHRIANWTSVEDQGHRIANWTFFEDQDLRILSALDYWLSPNESEVSGFMCEPRYSLTRRTVINSTQNVGAQDSLEIVGDIIETLSTGILPSNMTDQIILSLNWQSSLLEVKWNVWYALLNCTQPQENLGAFRNTSLVIELSQRFWPGYAAYVVKQDCTVPSKDTIDGTGTSTQGRLCVQELSLRLVEAHITLLLTLIVAVCFLRPGVFHRDPTSLGAHSMILATSPGLMDLLQGYGVASKQALRDNLSGYLASFPQHLSPENSTITLHQFQEGPEKTAESPGLDKSDPREWWSPVSVRWWFRISLMGAILAVVVALEALLQVSDRGKGLGDVILNGYLKYTWGFLPTVVLVLVGLLFSMVDSTARTLHPFQLLREGGATLEDMLHDPARQVSLMAVAYAARKRYFVLLWATLPGLLAPILTIITSGLYTVAPVPWTYDAELELEDWFRLENRTVDLDNHVEGDTGEAWTTFTLTQFSNMSYPQWTHGEYALASFGADNLRSHDGNDTSLSIKARVPATRANLNCSLIGYYANDTYQNSKVYGPVPKRLPVDPRPLGCHTPPERHRTAGQRNLYLTTYEAINVDGTHDLSRGYYLIQLVDDYFDTEPNETTFHPTSSISVCGDGRRHYFIGFGYGAEALSVLHCVPYVEGLWVTATFVLPDLFLAPDTPVTPDRDSSVFLSDSASIFSLTVTYFDEILMAAINGSSGIGQFTGPASAPDSNYTSRLIAAVEGALAQYFAQNLHFSYRQAVENTITNASASSPGQNFLTANGHPANGTVTDRTRLRLIQNPVSTRILQGLLGVMGACLVASTALGRGARVIPRDPGSVASRMAYFAGGDVWRHVPVGADRWTDEQIKRHGLGMSEGRLLLDWWEGDDQEDSEGRAREKRFAVDSTDRKEVA